MFVILDLEWNTAYNPRTKSHLNEIIEFGAVKLDENYQEIGSFSMLVKPQVGKTLTSLIEELTHISNEDLEDADVFPQVFSRFSRFAGGCILMAWGNMDILTLLANCQYFLKSERLSFARQYVDLQKFCERCFHFEENAKQIGLSTAAQELEIKFDEQTLHRALADSRLEAACFRRLLQKEENKPVLSEMIHPINEEFYKKILFKTVPLTDFNDPKIDKKELVMFCKKCGRQLKQKTVWRVVNNAFRARFLCETCKLDFEANVRFRLKYEGVSVYKYMRKLVPKEDQDKQTPCVGAAGKQGKV